MAGAQRCGHCCPDYVVARADCVGDIRLRPATDAPPDRTWIPMGQPNFSEPRFPPSYMSGAVGLLALLAFRPDPAL